MPSPRTPPSRRIRSSVLDQMEFEQVHEATLEVLGSTGISLHYPPAREMLRSHGATVDEARARVWIPRRLVEQALTSTPRSFAVHSYSDNQADCRLGPGGGQYGRPSTGLNWILDANARRRRPITEADAVAWTRITDALPNLHLAASAFDQEGSPGAMELRAVARMLLFSGKPLLVSGVGGEGIRWIARLAEVVQPPERQPRLITFSSVNSPLTYADGQAEAAMVSAELGIPVLVNSTGVAGVTAPVTMAGLLAQMNAELLAALVIIQLHRPGAPVLYAGHPMVMDMKTGMASHGFTEAGLATAAFIDLGTTYGVPTSSPGLMTDSCSPDTLAAVEKWATGYLPVLAGAVVSGGAGGLACQSTISLEQLVMDDDLYGFMFHQLAGIRVDEEALATGVIEQVGPGGSFLGEDHTLAHYRKEYWYSRLANRLTAPAWEEAGSKDGLERAADTVRTILSGAPEPIIPETVSQDLRSVLRRGEEALARPAP